MSPIDPKAGDFDTDNTGLAKNDNHNNSPDDNGATAAATEAIAAEHNLSVKEAFKKYPKAIMWSMVISLTIIMEGYDIQLLPNFMSLLQFRQQFGRHLPDGDYQVPSEWQSGISNSTLAAQIIGLLFAGVVADRYGYKIPLAIALVILSGVVFILFFAQSLSMILAGQLLCGLPWGMFQTLTSTYAADVAPVALRPILTTYVNLCWTMGTLISTGVMRGCLNIPGEWAWRIPYATQWVWPLPILVAIIFAPESPWWLVRQGRLDDARRSLRRLQSSSVSEDEMEQSLRLICMTTEADLASSQGNTGISYFDCFRGTNLRRTEIACCAWVIQVITGIYFGASTVYFLIVAGLPQERAFDMGLVSNAIACIGTMLAWYLIPRFGRRTLYLCGILAMLAILCIVGFMGIPQPTSAISYASGVLLILFILAYDVTVGPTCYCLVTEIPSARLRIKTVGMARASNIIASIGANFLQAPILNPSAWGLGGKGGFIWVGFGLVSFVWTFFRLPETKGLTIAEIDARFQQKIPTSKFQTADVTVFGTRSHEAAGDGSRSQHVEDMSKQASMVATTVKDEV